MATRLGLYNAALLEIGERGLSSLTEDREPRRVLDTVWNDSAIRYCLSKGQWKFATRSVRLEPSTSIAPGFGYQNAYPLPSDFVRTTAVFADEYGNVPLTAYRQEARHIFADIYPIYVSYVSDDDTYGGDLASWPEEFARFVTVYLASRIVWRITQNQSKTDDLRKLMRFLEREAKSSDAMEDPTKFPPLGSFERARLGRTSGRRDRGSRSTLTG